MARKDISRLCQAVLPQGFEQARRQIPRLQAFLDENLPETVRQSVTILSVDETRIVIAASTPMVTNFLRLHGAEIRQQLLETFGLGQELRFRTVPDALLQGRPRDSVPAPRAVSDESVGALRRNAEWIEDEKLRDAMLALADSLGGNSDK